MSVRSRNEGERVLIEISDDGPGIPEGEEASIFERFYRGDRDASSPGRGLGLTLAQEIARAHGGSIAARSMPDGAVFQVELPSAAGGGISSSRGVRPGARLRARRC